MIRFIVNAVVPHPLSVQFLKRIAKSAEHLEPKLSGTIEVNIVGDRRIKTLNKLYRGINKSTDVLSFAWQEDKNFRADFLGQLYLAPNYIAFQAKRFKVTWQEECCRMLVHGMLHIVGYDHQKAKDAKKMFAVQEKIVVSAK